VPLGGFLFRVLVRQQSGAHMKVGDKIETWFSDMPDGKSTIIAIDPYRGKYPQWFRHVLRVTAPRTKRGWLEVCA
jgi:hypothetical protein